MPRYVAWKPKSSDTRAKQAKTYQVYGYKNFLDPFQLGFGTEPEKIVYAALVRRGIEFYYLNDIKFAFPEIELFKEYQADFVIPAARIIIEVQGAYWHTMAKTIESDALKFAIYQEGGYKALAWWDYDIFNNINKLFEQTPELQALSRPNAANKNTELAATSRKKTDTSKGIRSQNQKRRGRLAYRKKPVTIKGKRKNYGTFRAKLK